MKESPSGRNKDILASIPESPGLDALFDALSDRRRREVVRYLSENGSEIALADLAAEVAAREHGIPIRETDPDEVERVYVSLYHAHVPKLANAGLVEYEPERDLVSPPERDERIERFLDVATAGD